MNQILACEKVYVTKEMKVKKKIFRLNFIMSIFLLFIFTGIQVYGEVDRSISEKKSEEILQAIKIQDVRPKVVENTKKEEEIIRVILNTSLVMLTEEEQNQPSQELDVPAEQKIIASDGTEYFAIGILNIPKININYPILSTTTEELLKNALCKFWGPNPNEIGNLCVVGHNYRDGKFFGKAASLVEGDVIELTDLSGRTITYSVYTNYIVEPDDVSCTSQLTQGNKDLTLITCTNNGKQRVVIKAREVK